MTGIGGIFFLADNPAATREWYARHLGLATTEWGSTFESRDMDRPDEVNQLQWSPFNRDSDYFAPSTRGFMINYRVQNLEGLVQQLRANGVTILDDIASYDYGKFVHILDADGNKLELWEPS
ncbi:VOC family protein [Hymenobacter sp. 5317J-9]|uniref:VOC family protein n=1 Tax=Hymenobacter sp. 5317J-9 TaxID=2932250 RepID=UPI001FD6CF18|nr:VOC family protein [Hymenobacter sp. 5317J-9]UOQ97675.1 VOC family protein [Hymenobacter sp. 5317J-9]